MKKIRADELLFQKGLVESRSRAKTLIMMGKVYANGVKVEKAGDNLNTDSEIEIKEDLPYVSRGGLKLESAIKHFNIDIKNKIALDIGASTGGFTDCLLKYGAKKVYAVDVGYGILDNRLREDKRVINIEKTNFRYIDKSLIPEIVDFISIDVSFISLTLIIPKALEFLKKNGEIVALIKPQFELTPKEVGKGGVVRDEKLREKAVDKIKNFSQSLGLTIIGIIPSPVSGQKGNKEFLLYAVNI
ncbi:MAG: TlyA family RNA methyltransferase [Proteobacteria bacterium]|nr:TlyA family RNA methyltransferase [Pseudomonadota bacterium]